MSFFLDIPFKKAPKNFSYTEPLFLIGSCFTEHIGNKLDQLHFNIQQNPHGILFDSQAIVHALDDYMLNRSYQEDSLFFQNDLWHSWAFHSRFSSTDKATTIHSINTSICRAHEHLAKSRWLVITLGSSFSYWHYGVSSFVANCHKVNQTAFQKTLVDIHDLKALWTKTLNQLFTFNPQLNIIFTISPVRHIRDGVIENNRSKARLLETVHSFVNNENIFYFPAYEYQIDILRDYRFYDIDLVHPNFAATEFIMERFIDMFLQDPEKELLEEMKELRAAYNHRSMHPDTAAHKTFKEKQLIKSRLLQKKYPFLNLKKEIDFFSS